jgi:hypothetical protein
VSTGVCAAAPRDGEPCGMALCMYPANCINGTCTVLDPGTCR